MKSLMVGFLALVSVNAQAASVSPEMGNIVVEALLERCDWSKIQSVAAPTISVSYKDVDQGQTDKFYTFVYRAVTGVVITINAAEYATTNPSVDKYEILSVVSPGVCE